MGRWIRYTYLEEEGAGEAVPEVDLAGGRLVVVPSEPGAGAESEGDAP